MTTTHRNTGTAITRKARGVYATTFHRDGSITVWDVYAQGWARTSTPSDSILASLDTRERARVIRHCHVNDKMC